MIAEPMIEPEIEDEEEYDLYDGFACDMGCCGCCGCSCGYCLDCGEAEHDGDCADDEWCPDCTECFFGECSCYCETCGTQYQK